jgi:hypothetical protein
LNVRVSYSGKACAAKSGSGGDPATPHIISICLSKESVAGCRLTPSPACTRVYKRATEITNIVSIRERETASSGSP